MASSNVTKLDPSSETFKRILYSLQVALRGTNVSGVHIWYVDTPSLRAKYERQTSAGGLELSSWVDVDALPAYNPVQEVCARGFRMPDDGSGLSFHTGHIDLAGVGDRNQHQFLLCRVAVGRAYALLEPDAPRTVPDGYDSLYLHHEDEDAEDEAAADAEPGTVGLHRHEYVLTNAAQALPQYIVHFDFDPADAVLGPPPSATMTLEERRDHFRAKVDEVRGEVSRALSVLGPSLGSRTEEMLADLTTKYEAALYASTKPEPLLEERKRSVRDGLRRITAKLEQVKGNSEAVYEEVCKRMQDALATLEALTKRKTAVLLSEELELRRQLRQIQAAEGMVPHLQETLQPTAFVEAWEAHQALRRELVAQMTGAGAAMVGEALDAVKPDLRVTGAIDVVAAADEAFGGGGLDASAVAARLFQSSVGTHGATGGSAAAAAAASAAPLSATWHSFIQQEAGLAGASSTFPPSHTRAPPSSSSSSSSSAAAAGASGQSATAMLDSIAAPSSSPAAAASEHARLQAVVALAKAELSSVRARATSLPFAQRELGEAAVQEKERDLAQAQAALAEVERQAGGGTSSIGRQPPASRHTTTSTTNKEDDEDDDDDGEARAAAATSGSRNPPPAPVTVPENTTAASSSSSSRRQARSPSRNAALQLERALKRNRLSTEAERRLRLTGLQASDVDTLAFPGSTILTGSDAHHVYACLPFVRPAVPVPAGVDPTTVPLRPPVPPSCALVFSTETAPTPDFPSLAAALARVGGPSVLVIKAGDAVFGAYASQPWRFDGLFHGDVSSFLFSVTRDVRIPFTGRIEGPSQDTDAEMRAQYDREYQARLDQWTVAMQRLRDEATAAGVMFNSANEVVANPNGFDLAPFAIQPPRHRRWKRVDAQYSDETRVAMGLTDLIIDGDLSACSSEIESTFGIGLRPGSQDAKTLLAGETTFAISALEVWHVGEAAYDGVDDDLDQPQQPQY